MNLLLDTHIVLWLLQDSPRLPARAVRLAKDGGNALFVSDISVWEVAIKHLNRPDKMPASSEVFIRDCEKAGYVGLPLAREAIKAYEGLDISKAEGIHRDPFDRMLIAQAKTAGMLLVTHDKSLLLYDEPCVLEV